MKTRIQTANLSFLELPSIFLLKRSKVPQLGVLEKLIYNIPEVSYKIFNKYIYAAIVFGRTVNKILYAIFSRFSLLKFYEGNIKKKKCIKMKAILQLNNKNTSLSY